MIMGTAPQLPLFTVIQLMFVEMDPGDCNNCLCNNCLCINALEILRDVCFLRE